SRASGSPAFDEAEGAVVVGQVSGQSVGDVLAGDRAGSGLLELFAQHGSGLDMRGVGDGLPARPAPGVVGDHASVGADLDPLEIAADLDDAADRARVDGVVVGVQT